LGDEVYQTLNLMNNPLSEESVEVYLPLFEAREVQILYTP